MAPDVDDLTNDPAKRMPDPLEIKHSLLRVALKHITLPRLVQVLELNMSCFRHHRATVRGVSSCLYIAIPERKMRSTFIYMIEKETTGLKRGNSVTSNVSAAKKVFMWRTIIKVTVSGIPVSLTHPCPCFGRGPGSPISDIVKPAGERQTDDSLPRWAEHDENHSCQAARRNGSVLFQKLRRAQKQDT